MNTLATNSHTDPKSLFNILTTDFVEGSIDREFIAKSFFLPKEILCSGKWKVEPIRVCSAKEWKQAEIFLRKQHASITYDPNSEEIISAAKSLGVSLRKCVLSGETFVVVKLWYGETTHQMFPLRKGILVGKKGSDSVIVAATDFDKKLDKREKE